MCIIFASSSIYSLVKQKWSSFYVSWYFFLASFTETEYTRERTDRFHILQMDFMSFSLTHILVFCIICDHSVSVSNFFLQFCSVDPLITFDDRFQTTRVVDCIAELREMKGMEVARRGLSSIITCRGWFRPLWFVGSTIVSRPDLNRSFDLSCVSTFE